MNIIFFINLVIGLLYLYHVDTSDVSKTDILIAAIIIFNLFLINKFKKDQKKREGSS
ncbi:MAG: hypothetical protein ACRCYC_14890 [Paraclostridium sp.]|uniref:hypothetical protein n=1 Tax=Paraclostridium sp. TaxID=2023273 RepID=UPI003F3D4196